MDPNVKLVAFYNFNEVNIKDIEKDLYTKDRQIFHFFFFNNRNLHFKKSKIYDESLIKEFENEAPEFNYDNRSGKMTMIKKIQNFDKKIFDKKVNENYRQYIKAINYRIECIFQTFTLFNNLYKDKMIIFAFPYQLYKKFIDMIGKIDNTKTKYEVLLKKEKLSYIEYFEMPHWVNYFFKISSYCISNEFKDSDIKAVIKINS
jgi:hypothetical protein